MRQGQRNDVVLDVRAGVVRRYPRTAAALADLDLSAARAAAARAAGLPAPEVLEVVRGRWGPHTWSWTWSVAWGSPPR